MPRSPKVPGASPMRAACAWLDANDVPYAKMTDYHLKIGEINFWPNRGTITIDGEGSRRASKGLAGLAKLLGKGLRSVP